MGFAVSRNLERGTAALGFAATSITRFENCRSVNNGGVLFALPALLLAGLFHNITNHFEVRKGHYYRVDQLFLMLRFFILARLKNFDRIQYEPAGECGENFLDSTEYRLQRPCVNDLRISAVMKKK